VTSKKEKKLCFVIGPIGDAESEARNHADWLLEGIIQPVMSEFPEYTVKRADQDARPGLIDAQMINDLLNAELVIADLTFVNPNAFYEIGIRHMAQKPIIHMQLATEKTPFDVSLYRAIKFSRSKFRDLEQAKIDLRRAIEAVLREGYEVENPVTNARGRLKLEQHATPEIRVLLEQVRTMQTRLERLEFPGRTSMSVFGGGSSTYPSDQALIRVGSKRGVTPEELKIILQAIRNRFTPVEVVGTGRNGVILSLPATAYEFSIEQIKPPFEMIQHLDFEFIPPRANRGFRQPGQES
jgi:hypothetical protein